MISGPDGPVMGRGKVFGEVVSQVGRAFIPINKELILVNMILDPTEAHVNGLRAASVHNIVGNSSCSGVVHLDRGRALGKARFLEGSAKNYGVLAVTKPANISLRGGGYNNFEAMCSNQD